MEKLKILVVDDEERMRKLLQDFLKMKDYEVLLAADGEEAIDIFFRKKDIALVILDVMMPKMDGWEVLKTIAAPGHRKKKYWRWAGFAWMSLHTV